MTNPKALIVGIAVLILIVTGSIFASRKLSQIKVSQPTAKVSPSPSPSPQGFSALSRDVEKLERETTLTLKSQPETGIGDVKNVGIYLSLPLAGNTIASPVNVSGFANVYDGLVKIRVKDESGNVLGENSTYACMGADACHFETTVTFIESPNLAGVIETWGLDQNQQSIAQTIPITFK